MGPSTRGIVGFILLLVAVASVTCQSSEATPTVGPDGCLTYEQQVETSFHKDDNTKWTVRRNENLVIANVTNTRRDSVYWCQLKMRDEPLYRNYGFNRTHWYVTRGCSGMFKVTECPSSKVAELPPPDSGPQVQGSVSHMSRLSPPPRGGFGQTGRRLGNMRGLDVGLMPPGHK